MKRCVLFLFMLSLAFGACKKGDTGPAGEDGIDGNANVAQYSFGPMNLATTFGPLQISTTKDTMENSTWLVYIWYESLDRWYFLPGPGVGGSTVYRVSMTHASGKVNIYIDKTGPGETYAKVKVVRIYNSNSFAGGRSANAASGGLPPVDITDYEAVRRYYDLPK